MLPLRTAAEATGPLEQITVTITALSGDDQPIAQLPLMVTGFFGVAAVITDAAGQATASITVSRADENEVVVFPSRLPPYYLEYGSVPDSVYWKRIAEQARSEEFYMMAGQRFPVPRYSRIRLAPGVQQYNMTLRAWPARPVEFRITASDAMAKRRILIGLSTSSELAYDEERGHGDYFARLEPQIMMPAGQASDIVSFAMRRNYDSLNSHFVIHTIDVDAAGPEIQAVTLDVNRGPDCIVRVNCPPVDVGDLVEPLRKESAVDHACSLLSVDARRGALVWIGLDGSILAPDGRPAPDGSPALGVAVERGYRYYVLPVPPGASVFPAMVRAIREGAAIDFEAAGVPVVDATNAASASVTLDRVQVLQTLTTLLADFLESPAP